MHSDFLLWEIIFPLIQSLKQSHLDMGFDKDGFVGSKQSLTTTNHGPQIDGFQLTWIRSFTHRYVQFSSLLGLDFFTQMPSILILY